MGNGEEGAGSLRKKNKITACFCSGGEENTKANEPLKEDETGYK